MHNVLYLGLEVPEGMEMQRVVHCPLIKTIPRSFTEPKIQEAFKRFSDYSHIIFTSKTAVSICVEYALHFGVDKGVFANKCLLAVGTKTAERMSQYGLTANFVATEETSEGIVAMLEAIDLSQAFLFWPHSALSRPVISNWLKGRGVSHCNLPLYDTVANIPEKLPELHSFDEIVFTSPSTVDAFLKAYHSIPMDKKLTSIGPVTQQYLFTKRK